MYEIHKTYEIIDSSIFLPEVSIQKFREGQHLSMTLMTPTTTPTTIPQPTPTLMKTPVLKN